MGVAIPVFDFFLKDVENVDSLAQSDHIGRPKCTVSVLDCYFEYATAKAVERLCIGRQLPKLHFVKRKADRSLHAPWQAP